MFLLFIGRTGVFKLITLRQKILFVKLNKLCIFLFAYFRTRNVIVSRMARANVRGYIRVAFGFNKKIDGVFKPFR